MPQLDIVTYNYINLSLFLVFWLHFAILYVAVSYTMQKVSTGIYFKFVTLMGLLLTLSAIRNIDVMNTQAQTPVKVNKQRMRFWRRACKEASRFQK